MAMIVSMLSSDEMDHILADIEEAHGFLAATSACRFLIDLLTTPGVQDEINRQGGWSTLEYYAKMSWNHQLWKLFPEDAHLVLMCNFEALLQRLQNYLLVMEQHVSSCQDSLAALARRFRVSAKSQKVLRKFPQIAVIARWLEEAEERSNAFPTVCAI